MVKNASLLTDDGGMYTHAEEIGADSILIRDTELKDIEKFILERKTDCAGSSHITRAYQDEDKKNQFIR